MDGQRGRIELQSADSLGWLQVDNVDLHQLNVPEFIWVTECDGITAPPNLNLVRNGDFSAGLEEWSWWGGIDLNATARRCCTSDARSARRERRCSSS